MLQYVEEFLLRFEFEEDAKRAFMEGYRRIENNASAQAAFQTCVTAYKSQRNVDFGQLIESCKTIALQSGVHEYTCYALLLVALSEQLKKYYEAEGYGEKMWETIMRDIRWKAVECKLIHDVWGTFVPTWYVRIFHMSRFGFGNLQFNTVLFDGEYDKDGVVLKPDSLVIGVHIPRTGQKLDRELCLRSYDEAANFFAERFGAEKVFACHSWLLYPKNKEILKPTSNLAQFINDYELVDWGEYPDPADTIWRLFDTKETDWRKLPQDTSLRRAYVDLLRRGEKLGWGKGVMTYGKTNRGNL